MQNLHCRQDPSHLAVEVSGRKSARQRGTGGPAGPETSQARAPESRGQNRLLRKDKEASAAQAAQAAEGQSGPRRASVDGLGKTPSGAVPEEKDETDLLADLVRDSKKDLADTERAMTKRAEPDVAISIAGGAQLVTRLNAQSTENELETSGKEAAGVEEHMGPSLSPEGSGQDRDMKPTMESGSRDPPQFPVEMAPSKAQRQGRHRQGSETTPHLPPVMAGLEPAQLSPDLPFETF